MKMHAGCVALLAAGLVGCGGVAGTVDAIGEGAEALVVPSAVANMVPSGVVESTGNLYWTRNTLSGGAAPGGSLPLRWTGRVYRAGKTSAPGQETVLYSETGSGFGSSFGNITFANYGGVWYGYFLATSFGGTVVKRVPLDGSSPAITFGDAPSLASASSPLLSDGMYLYFSGANGLYAAPLDGGRTVTVTPTAGVTSFGFDRAHVYFGVGNELRSAWKPNYGNGNTWVRTFSEPIVSIFVSPGADNEDSATSAVIGTTHSVVLWTQLNNRFAPGFYSLEYRPSASISSVSAGGSHVMWTECDAAANTCYVGDRDLGQVSWPVRTLVQTGARSIMGDASQMFFVDNYALERLAH
jgi:hypothetical protein